MVGDWAHASIEDVAEKVAMGPFGSSIKVETFVEQGIPVISGQHLKGTRLNDEVGYNFISEEHAQRLSKANVYRGDVIFTHAGSIGQVAYIPEDSLYSKYVLSQRQFFMRCDRSRVLPEFVTAYFKSPEGQHALLANRSQVGVPSLAQPVTYLRQLELPLPALVEQRAIVSALGVLDDKIELNRRMNATLEAMAQAVFKEWFVDGAKEEWPEATIDDVATRTACGPFGSSIKTDTFVDEGVPVISGQHLWGVMMEDNTFNYLTSEHAQKLSKAKVRRGDVIFTHAGSIGQAAFIPETSRYEEYVVSQRQFFMRCNLSKVTPLFMAMYFHSPDGRHKLLANTSSSGVPSIARPVTHLRSIEFTLPPIELQQDFGRLVSPMYDRIQANKNESLTLAALRDTLLPKLMRGEVKVKENSTAPINV